MNDDLDHEVWLHADDFGDIFKCSCGYYTRDRGYLYDHLAEWGVDTSYRTQPFVTLADISFQLDMVLMATA